MKKLWRRLGALLIAAVMVLSVTVREAGTVYAAGTLPTQVTNCENSSFNGLLTLGFGDDTAATNYVKAINKVTVNDTEFTKGTFSYWGNTGTIWNTESAMGAYGNYQALKICNEKITFPAKIVISADGYDDMTVSVKYEKYEYSAEIVQNDNKPSTGSDYKVVLKASANGTVNVDKVTAKEGEKVTVTASPADGYVLDTISVKDSKNAEITVTGNTFAMPASDVTVSAVFKANAPAEDGTVSIDSIKMETDFFSQNWYFTFPENVDYVSKITGVSVNGTAWNAISYNPSSGGFYRADTSNSRLTFAAKDFSSSSTVPVLKSGDVITITADGYKDLTFKILIDTNGKMTATADDGQGDNMQLYVKLEGNFECAIVGQKDYDGVSSATGAASSNNNSNVTVYGALVEKGKELADSDWKELNNDSDINIVGSKSKVNIVPDTSKGTSKDADSGMEGVYLTISSALTLNGTPKDAGDYLISVSVTDDQGRTAESNALPFTIYTGNEKLADRLVLDNLTQTQDGKYMWNIMEPWAIRDFGSNTGEEESVRIPKDVKAWYGSNESGTYGYLGYDIAWKDVQSGNIPQTLYIPSGCNLTFVNMKILSSVHIIVEDGGTLNLMDSTVQGIIDVQSGGTFSMNYDSFNKTFVTGASVCGQVRMADGSILENAAVYSHANYLANGDLTDRSTSDPVVTTTGNVTVKGNVFIQGDSAGTEIGQTALQVKDGTLTLEDGATLAAFGGDGTTLIYSQGGTAIKLDNGKITGSGKLIAIGGDVLFGDGGNAVEGNGTLSTTETFLQGSTAFGKATPGKATGGTIKISSPKQSVKDGEQLDTGSDDPLAALYWKTGIDPMPPLDKYITTEVPIITYTVTYTDGVDDEVIFEDQVTTDLSDGDATPAFNGTPDRDGYTFKGWNPAVAETVSGDITYTAQWEKKDTSDPKDPTKPSFKKPSNNGNSGNGNTTGNASADNKNTKSSNAKKTPKTGDESHMMLWIVLMLAAVAMSGVIVYKRKRS